MGVSGVGLRGLAIRELVFRDSFWDSFWDLVWENRRSAWLQVRLWGLGLGPTVKPSASDLDLAGIPSVRAVRGPPWTQGAPADNPRGGAGEGSRALQSFQGTL